MGKFRLVAIAALVVAALGCILWLALRETPEPTYQGKPLQFWLEAYNPGNHAVNQPQGPAVPTFEEANEAVRKMGTNAIPTLLRMLQKHDSKIKLMIRGLLRKQHIIKVSYSPAAYQDSTALEAFRTLGSEASNAVPSLIAIFDRDPSPFPQQAIPAILGEIGPAATLAIPSLLRGVTHTNELVRNNSIYALGRIHAEPELVVPVLINCLHDSDSLVRMQAALALAAFGTNAQSAVPALLVLWRTESTTTSVGSMVRFYTPVSPTWTTSSTLGGSLGWTMDVVGATKDALQAIAPEVAAKAGVK